MNSHLLEAVTLHPAVYVPISELVVLGQRINKTQASTCLPKSHRSSKIIRVIGRQSAYNPSSSRLVLEDVGVHSSTLFLDISRIEPFSYHSGCLCLFIGDVGIGSVNARGTILLQVLLHRCIKELNIDVYSKAYALRKSNLKARCSSGNISLLMDMCQKHV